MTRWPGIDNWYETSTLRTMVREYDSLKAMQADAERASQFGWDVISTSEMSQRSGCLRIMTLGLLSLIWKPKSHIMTTYRRDQSDTPNALSPAAGSPDSTI